MTQTFIVNGVDVLQRIKDLEQENKQMKSALEEIRGFAQSITDEFEEMDFEQQKHYCDEISNDIVNKINEVLK